MSVLLEPVHVFPQLLDLLLHLLHGVELVFDLHHISLHLEVGRVGHRERE